MCARQIQTKHQSVYAGSRLKPTMCGKVLSYRPAFQPYRGKPAVRNDREGRGNVGIIRSPIRASTLPDCGGREVTRVPTAKCVIAALAHSRLWHKCEYPAAIVSVPYQSTCIRGRTLSSELGNRMRRREFRVHHSTASA